MNISTNFLGCMLSCELIKVNSTITFSSKKTEYLCHKIPNSKVYCNNKISKKQMNVWLKIYYQLYTRKMN